MKLIHPSEADKKHWDALVASAVSNGKADVFSSSWYLDACAQDWYILADDAFENGIALPYTVKLGVQAVSPPIFVRNLDFVGNDENFPAQAFDYIRQQFKAAHLQVSTQLPISNTLTFQPSNLPTSQLPNTPTLQPSNLPTFQLPNTPTLQPSNLPTFQPSNSQTRTYQTVSIAPALNSQAKRMLQKATKNGISVAETSDWKSILTVIRQELSEKIREFTPQNLQRLARLVASLEDERQLFCLGIYRNEVLEGGMIFMDSAGKRIYLKGASSRETRDLGGMYLCMNEAIQQAVAENRLFDFGGSEVEGVRRFNLNLGGTDRHYYIYSWNNAPWWFNLTKRMYQKWKKK